MQDSTRNLVSLIVPREEAARRINEQISRLEEIVKTKVIDVRGALQLRSFYGGWKDYTKELLRRLFSNDDIANEFASTKEFKITTDMDAIRVKTRTGWMARLSYDKLLSITERLNLYPETLIDTSFETKESAINILDRLCNCFHSMASQLTKPQRSLKPIHISNEYDLQDLFYALLKMFFDDVRREEPTPTYAGKSAKADLLIKSQKIVVELKMTRPSLKDKKVGDELIIDIERYKQHPDCKVLFCFIYDPNRYMKNPVGIENDLSGRYDNIEVKVIVSPKN